MYLSICKVPIVQQCFTELNCGRIVLARRGLGMIYHLNRGAELISLELENMSVVLFCSVNGSLYCVLRQKIIIIIVFR